MTAQPIPSGERLEILDVLRGFALFGIISVNTLFFAQPAAKFMQMGTGQGWDAVVHFAIAWFAQAKFYGLFSFLFGMGFAIQMERWEAIGPRRFRRRLFGLLGIGLCHGLLVWSGDILLAYAAIGFLLPWFRNAKPRTLVIWILSLLGFLTLLSALLAGLVVMGQTMAPAKMDQAMQETLTSTARTIELSRQAYGAGPYAALFRFRAHELVVNYSMCLLLLPHIFAMFLLGLWTWKTGVFQNQETQRRVVRRWAWMGVLGLLGSAVYAWLVGKGLASGFHFGLLSLSVSTLASPLLTLGYIAAFAWWLNRTREASLIRALQWSGRMALTNYLTQSVVMTSLFYFYGLGLFGRLRLPVSLSLALVIALLQVPLSRWWLSRHSQGPAEWLWRRLTYGRAS